jgi:hypothetical protein
MKNWLIKKSYKLTEWLGARHMPFTHKLITSFDYYHALEMLRPGDVLLSLIYGEFSNFFIPGHFKHAAIYCGTQLDRYPCIIEAVSKGVIKKNMLDFMFKKDEIMAFRPTFCTKNDSKSAVFAANKLVGSHYDYQFKSDNDAFYCSEAIYYSYLQVLGEKMPFQMWKRFGRLTITPNDFHRALHYWEPVWRSQACEG